MISCDSTTPFEARSSEALELVALREARILYGNRHQVGLQRQKVDAHKFNLMRKLVLRLSELIRHAILKKLVEAQGGAGLKACAE